MNTTTGFDWSAVEIFVRASWDNNRCARGAVILGANESGSRCFRVSALCRIMQSRTTDRRTSN